MFYPTTNIWNLIFVLMYFLNSNNIVPPPPKETFSIPPQINICICTWLKYLRKVWLYTSNAPHIDDHCILLNAFKTQKVNIARPCRCMMGMELPWSLQQVMPYYQCITLHLFIGKHKLFSNLMITYKIDHPHMKLKFVFVGAFKFSMVLVISIKYIIYI